MENITLGTDSALDSSLQVSTGQVCEVVVSQIVAVADSSWSSLLDPVDTAVLILRGAEVDKQISPSCQKDSPVDKNPPVVKFPESTSRHPTPSTGRTPP